MTENDFESRTIVAMNAEDLSTMRVVDEHRLREYLFELMTHAANHAVNRGSKDVTREDVNAALRIVGPKYGVAM